MKISSKRFDFGVPLEDVFPSKDIHPRLKFLFSEAYQIYIQSGLTIEEVLRNYQDSVEKKLELKERLVHDNQFEKLSNYLPGTYFWLIRHFLGLLPISLMPSYSDGTTFNWRELSKACKNFFRHYQYCREKKSELDYLLAKNMDMLPYDHFILINVLVTFIRKSSQISEDDSRLIRKRVIALIRFYCGSIFNRPYRPGYEIEDKMMSPLFLYLVLRWQEIQKISNKIGHTVYFLEEIHCGKKNITDSWVQTSLFNPEIITMFKNIPYAYRNNIYLKDTGSQTESYFTSNKGIQITEELNISKSNPFIYSSDILDILDSSNAQDINNDPKAICEVYESQNSGISNEIDKYKIGEINLGQHNNENDISDPVEENSEINFYSIIDSSKNDTWTDILNDTLKTVKKVEEYIYDDYETFTQEDFNQITNNLSKPRLLRKISKLNFSATPKTSPEYFVNEKCNDNSRSSYLRMNSDIEKDYSIFYTNDNSLEKENDSLNVTFKSCYSSDDNLCSARADNSKIEGKNKTNFNLKRFKIKMDFLRMLTPRRSTPLRPTYYCTSSVNYKKIKNVKASTL